ncbi:MAG: haloacid dehalogenase type II [Candidatus Promineifilaceae bacterium]
MPKIILFDVNETLLDLSPLQPHFRRAFGDAGLMSQWFALLLHSSLVVTLTDAYSDFGALAGTALDVIARHNGFTLEESDRTEILATMRRLPPHPEVPESLERLKAAGLRLATLTNSPGPILAAQMSNAGLADYFEQLISVDAVGRFKPAPEPYRLAADKLGVDVEQVRLVAAHDWDVQGALRAGCHGAFIARRGKIYHPLYEKPDIVGLDLREVADRILAVDLR